MEPYVLAVYVTIEQETAIRELFSYRGWPLNKYGYTNVKNALNSSYGELDGALLFQDHRSMGMYEIQTIAEPKRSLAGNRDDKSAYLAMPTEYSIAPHTLGTTPPSYNIALSLNTITSPMNSHASHPHSLPTPPHITTPHSYSVSLPSHSIAPTLHTITSPLHSQAPHPHSLPTPPHINTPHLHSGSPPSHSIAPHIISPTVHSTIPHSFSIGPPELSTTISSYSIAPPPSSITSPKHSNAPHSHSMSLPSYNIAPPPHSISLPQHTHNNVPPTHSTTQSLHSIFLPPHSIAPPSHSIAPPPHSIAPPPLSIAPPPHIIAPPSHSIALPPHSISPPTHIISLPPHSIAPPLHSITPPQTQAAESSILSSVPFPSPRSAYYSMDSQSRAAHQNMLPIPERNDTTGTGVYDDSHSGDCESGKEKHKLSLAGVGIQSEYAPRTHSNVELRSENGTDKFIPTTITEYNLNLGNVSETNSDHSFPEVLSNPKRPDTQVGSDHTHYPVTVVPATSDGADQSPEHRRPDTATTEGSVISMKVNYTWPSSSAICSKVNGDEISIVNVVHTSTSTQTVLTLGDISVVPNATKVDIANVLDEPEGDITSSVVHQEPSINQVATDTAACDATNSDPNAGTQGIKATSNKISNAPIKKRKIPAGIKNNEYSPNCKKHKKTSKINGKPHDDKRNPDSRRKNIQSRIIHTRRSARNRKNMHIISNKRTRRKVVGKVVGSDEDETLSIVHIIDVSKPETTNEVNVDTVCEEQKRKKSENYQIAFPKNVDKVPKGSYHCDDCNVTFRSYLPFVNHKRNGGQCVFICHVCGKSFTFKDYRNYEMHVKYHNNERNFPCSECSKSFFTADTLATHVRSQHHGEKPYVCELCGQAFAYPSGLISHNLWRHSTKAELHACDICGKKYKSKYYVTQHKKCVHTDILSHACDVCGRQFKTKALLSSHVATHSDVKQYFCELCDRGFRRREGLKTHQLRHSNERNFSCEVCPRSFYERRDLEKHVRVHSGEKPYKCEVCPYRATRHETLHKHRKTHKLNKMKPPHIQDHKDNVTNSADGR